MEVVVWWESGKPPMEIVGRSRIVTNHSRIVTSQQTLTVSKAAITQLALCRLPSITFHEFS